MSMVCKICGHPKRLEMDRKVVEGVAIQRIAQIYGVSYGSLSNHSKNHIHRQLTQALEKKQLIEGTDLLQKIDQIIERAENIFTRNYEKKHDVTALKALDSQRSTIDLLAKISYQLHQSKMAELELQKQNSIEVQQEQTNKHFEEVRNLFTEEEILVMRNMQYKLNSKDKSFDCFEIGVREIQLTIDGVVFEIYSGTTPHEIREKYNARINKSKLKRHRDNPLHPIQGDSGEEMTQIEESDEYLKADHIQPDKKSTPLRNNSDILRRK